MADSRPIGVFDSGLGGVSVLHEIRRILPYENILYCADSGHAPYGEKSPELIRSRSSEIAEFLLEQGSKALVLACNTATAAAGAHIREIWPNVPVIGMEPAVKPAAEATRSGVVGVLATTGTLESARFAGLLDTFGQGVRVVTRPGRGLVEAVEHGARDTPELRALLASHLDPLLGEGADVVVLGCTHYVFLRAIIESIVGPGVSVIDTGVAVAKQVLRRLREAELLSSSTQHGSERFWTSTEPATQQPVLSMLWHADVALSRLPQSVCMPAANA